VSQKTGCKFVFVRTSSNFHQFLLIWQVDSKESRIMRLALIFHLI